MKPESLKKYKPIPVVANTDRQWCNNTITKAPIWCSVDLRDGNQALAIPMNLEQKLELFKLLVSLGFKQIEVGFPSASDTEFAFLRQLIEDDLVPDDVTLQVLVQAREHLIDRTCQSLKGAKKAIIHLYNSTSPLQRKVTFRGATKQSILDIAVSGVELIKTRLNQLEGTEVTLQYSPESFSDTETDYALEVCEAVMNAWGATQENPVILNLPATVEWTTPNQHADQIEWFIQHLSNREAAIISLHTHNDRGTGVAATELGLLAGADRVEGTLFGNGERTGNLDLVIVALNMNMLGIETGLDFSDMQLVKEIYTKTTAMTIHERHPYAGELVFTAFSGSHQDAIKKGFDLRNKAAEEQDANLQEIPWEVPYLTIDPQDIGSNYEAIVRINSQSGKGGVTFILEKDYGFELPKSMQPQVGAYISQQADEEGKELDNKQIKELFKQNFVNINKPISFESTVQLSSNADNITQGSFNIGLNGQTQEVTGSGNGPISALVSAIRSSGLVSINFQVTDYRSHALSGGSEADSIAYVQLKNNENQQYIWAAGVDSSIEKAGLKALISALNLLLA